MSSTDLVWLAPAFALVAFLYASVGHGGASGYLALLALAPGVLAPAEMATTALTLNVIVAGVAWGSYLRAGFSRWKLVWPFALASVPAAFLAGRFAVGAEIYAVLLAVALLAAAYRLLGSLPAGDGDFVRAPQLRVALPVGGAIGWLSGAIGVGGGIFLSPLVVLKRWASPRITACAAALFIVLNSLAGLAGRAVGDELAYGGIWPLALAALAGGLLGARSGSRRIPTLWLNRLLAVVLLAAVVKLVVVTSGGFG